VAHFYLSETATDAEIGGILVVTGPEARHAVTVGRLKTGERLSVGDGQGMIAEGVVSAVGADRFELSVEATRFEDAPRPAIWLAQALAQNDRDELAIQAATELGVDGVIPWAAGRSIVKWEGAKVRRHEERWASILREASKQSVRHRVPELRPLTSTSALARLGEEFQLVVLEPTAGLKLSALPRTGRDLLLVVGPEGGIAPAELAGLAAGGASAVSLGTNILRASTAGPAAIAVLSVALGRW
jgi:16S rRNA (uracil1498-N3)-methyltransferase